MDYRHLLISRDGPIERVTLNRPEVRNAFNDEVVAELTAWADRCTPAARPRVVVLAGAGRSFSAGADLAWMTRMADSNLEANVADAQALARMFEALDTLPVPVVGRVHGAALGGGCGLAAVCDVVVAASDAVFGFTEVRLGLAPAVISPYIVAKIGRSAARELLLTGGRFPAARAREIGLVHRVVPPEDLDRAVADCVRDCLAGGPDALADTKALIADIGTSDARTAQATTTAVIARRRVSPEGQEGMRAFLDKRRASWRAD